MTDSQAELIAHLLKNRPKKLKKRPPAEMREQEESHARLMTPEVKHFLMAYGRTVPASTPPLPEAEARYLSLGAEPPQSRTFGALSHGLFTHCLRFAGWITPPPRKTRFRLRTLLCRAGFTIASCPAGFLYKVSVHHFSSLSKLSWRSVVFLADRSA